MKKFLAKLKNAFSIFAMMLGGIGCVSLFFSIPGVFFADDIKQKGMTVACLLVTVAAFAALFAWGVTLRSKKADPKAQNAPQETAEPAKKEEAAPAADTEPTQNPDEPETPDSDSKPTSAPEQPEASDRSPYPETEISDATPEFLECLQDIPLYTIHAGYLNTVKVGLSGDFLLFSDRADAEKYVHDSGWSNLSVLNIPLIRRNEFLSACRAAGYQYALVYAGNGSYRKAPFLMLDALFLLPATKRTGIAIPGLMPRFYSWMYQIDYTKRKQEQTGESPKDFWLRHLNDLLVECVARLLDSPLTLPILWDSKNNPEVRAVPQKTDDGRTVIPVYSDRFAVEHHLGHPADCVAVPHLLDDILQNMNNHPEVDGICLNPGRESIFLPRKVLEEAEQHIARTDPLRQIPQRLTQPMRQPTPDHRLYLMPILFDGETNTPEEPDNILHVWPGAAMQLVTGRKLTLRQPLPEGMKPTGKPNDRMMHGRLIKNPKTGMEFVPLYSTLDPIFKVYGKNARISVITFGEAEALSRGYAGVILEPGPNQHIIFNPDDSKK